MNKKNISYILIISVLSLVSIAILSFGTIQNNKKDNLAESALIISDIVKNGFNSINEEKKNHEGLYTTLASIVNSNHINSIHFVKNESFDNSYNKKRIDLKEVKSEYMGNSIFYKMPIKAKWNNINDCTKCHNVKYGEEIGVLSLELSLSGNEKDLSLIYYIPLIVLFAIFIIVFISNKSIQENSLIFERLSRSLNSALNGKYKKINNSFLLSQDTSKTIEKYNNLIGVIEETSSFIDTNLKGFVGSDINNKNVTPLEESKNIISNLSNLYQFKKEVEHDNSNEEILNRISEIFINKYNLKNFNFVEINTANNKIKILKEYGDCFYCGSDIKNDPSLCRAARINTDVASIDYHQSCPYFKEKNKFHYCISTNIIKSTYLIANFVFDNKEELDELKNKISIIKSYINESIPSIEVKLLMNALQESAYKDGLTGLYNRKFLDLELQKLVPLAKREKFNIGVLLLDMDHFKAVNDEYGHDIGDKVLKELALILSETVRDSDIVVRYGGEEFVVLLVNVKTEINALDIANKIRIRVSEREIDAYAGSKLKKTVSIGLSMYPKDSSSIDSVIKNADIALYEAKNKGRNQVIRFNQEQVSSVDLF